MAKAKHSHFGIGEAPVGSFKPDKEEVSLEVLAASHEEHAEAARERAIALADVSRVVVALEHKIAPDLSEIAQRFKIQIDSVQYPSFLKDIAIQLSLSRSRGLLASGEYEELFALLQKKQVQLKGTEPIEPEDPYAPAKPWSPSGILDDISSDPYDDIEKRKANDMLEPEED